MLRPQKGEGERSAKLNKRRKAPQVILVALIVSTPLCLAQSAMASTSSFGTLSEQQPQSGSQQTGSRFLASNLPNRILQTKFASSAPIISQSDISALETRLSQYKTTLATLKAKPIRNPSLQATVQEQIRIVNQQISDLEDLITQAKQDLADYTAAQDTLSKALARYAEAQNNTKAISEKVSTYQQEYESHTDVYNKATQEYDASLITLNNLKADLQAAEDALSSADASLTSQTIITNNALTDLNNAKALASQASASVATAEQQFLSAQANLEDSSSNKSQAQSAYDIAFSNFQDSQSAFNVAEANLQSAQNAYDTNLIPDPNWTAPTQQVAHTRLVPHTETITTTTLVPHTTTTVQQQTIPNILFNSDFSQGTSGWSGVSTGWQGSSPALMNNEVTFSYSNQSVSQGLFSGPFQNATLTLSADWKNNDLNRGITDTYSMTVEARDINQNLVGTATYNSTGSHDWETKSVTLNATGPVSYITVTFTGIDNGYWYGVYGPKFKAPSLSITHGQEVTQTAYEEVTTSEEVTTYTEETYYTTEPLLIQKTLQVDIREGGQATFYAPAGATFVSSNLRYEAIARPQCGSNINPNIQGQSSVTLRALNSVYGDPCGGWVKHIVGTITYTGNSTAPLIKNPDLLLVLQEAQDTYATAVSNQQLAELTFNDKYSELNNAISSYDIALSNKQAASEELSSTQSVMDSAVSIQSTNQDVYNTELAKQTALESTKTQAQTVVSTTTETVTTTQADVDTKAQVVATAQSVKDTTFQTLSTEQANLATASEGESVALATKSQAEDTLVVKQKLASTSIATASTKAEVISFTQVETTIDTPPDEGSKEIPADLSADNLMSVDLTAVDPTELTVAQAEQLKEAAIETFLTAEVGSPEYEQALDALYLAAEQDDIVLDPALAAVPVLGAAVQGLTDAINFLGNAGADMSPKVRESSKKVVIAGVVAVGAAVASATGAATSAASSSSSSGSGSGSTRRKQ